MAWRRRPVDPSLNRRTTVVIVIGAFLAPFVQSAVFGEGPFVYELATGVGTAVVLMLTLMVIARVPFAYERVPD